MRIGTLFSGIGSPEMGAKRVYDNLELVFACEWDRFARESFKANYEIEDKHFHKDISDMDGTQYKGKVDILIGGSPCQDFSLAGLRKGIDGNKGILIYEYIRIIKEVGPPIFIYENVKGMLSDKGGKTIKDFVEAFREMGYSCHYEVLNTKDYGVPQNRERIFLVGFKDSEHYHRFAFAPKVKLEKRLKDVLEDEVNEKFYLKDDYLLKIIDISNVKGILSKGKWDKINESARRVCNINKFSPTIHTMGGGNTEPKIFEDVIPLQLGNSKSRGECIGKESQVAYCLRASEPNGIIENNYKIRKLTPRECFRLQDFPDTFKFVVSNSQLYKQAGNSISVNMMEMIFRQIEKSRYESCLGGLF